MTSRSRTPGSLRLTIRLIQRVREHRFVLAAALASMFVAGLAETAPIGLATIFVKQVLMREEGHEPSMLGQKAEAFGAMLVESVGAEVSDPRQESLVGIVVLVLMVGVLTAGATFANTFF
ncbi:MAG: hypothetical protein KDB53_03845, partial [Planctomycetes bacterium]|nr:hypothetical protein [Planctomycetota bacterium]